MKFSGYILWKLHMFLSLHQNGICEQCTACPWHSLVPGVSLSYKFKFRPWPQIDIPKRYLFLSVTVTYVRTDVRTYARTLQNRSLIQSLVLMRSVINLKLDGGKAWGRISDACITWRRWDDITWRRKKGRTVQLALRNVHTCILRGQVHKRMLNAADGWQLWEKKAKKSAHRRNQESDRRTRKSSEVESTYWKFLHKSSI